MSERAECYLRKVKHIVSEMRAKIASFESLSDADTARIDTLDWVNGVISDVMAEMEADKEYENTIARREG